MGLYLGKWKANESSKDETTVAKICHPQHDVTDYFARLPNEILEKILSDLKYLDRYFLAKVFPSVQEVAQSFRKMDLSLDYRLLPEVAEEIFTPSEYLESVTYLNLNGVYWFSKETLTMFISRVKNVKALFILGTRVLYRDLIEGEILNLTKLCDVAVIDYDEMSPTSECNKYWNITCVSFRDFDRKKSSTLLWDYRRQVLELEKDFYKTIILIEQQYWGNSLEFKKIRDFSKEDDDTIVINLATLRNLIEVGRICAESSNTREFILKNCQWSRDVQIIDLSPIKKLRGLHTLNLELFGDYATNCLEDIFKSCRELRSLKVSTDVPNFKVAYFEYATKLEDISFNTTCKFQVNKFLTDLRKVPVLKLRRIMLRYDNCRSFSKECLTSYLEENSQLLLFYIMCNMTRKTRTKVQKTFKQFIKSPMQLYLIERESSCYVPFIHLDMFRNCCYIKSNMSFVIYNKFKSRVHKK